MIRLLTVLSLAITASPLGIAVGQQPPESQPVAASQSACGYLAASADTNVTWHSIAGRDLLVRVPEWIVHDPASDMQLPQKTIPGKLSVSRDQASLEFTIDSDAGNIAARGTGTLKITLPAQVGDGDVLLGNLSMAFDPPLRADVELILTFDVSGDPVNQMGLPERNGVFKVWPMFAKVGGAGRFELGNAAKGPVQCSELGLPAVGLIFGQPSTAPTSPNLQLAVAADPYCGSYFQAQADPNKLMTHITLRTTYMGSVIPVGEETRSIALEFHRGDADRTLRCFYRTIPEILPGASWIQEIQLVYYDYLSDKGAGWFNDLQTLADKIPPARRGLVAVCLHGWYDYFQQYAYDHKSGKLSPELCALATSHCFITWHDGDHHKWSVYLRAHRMQSWRSERPHIQSGWWGHSVRDIACVSE